MSRSERAELGPRSRQGEPTADGTPVPLILLRGGEEVVREVGGELRATGWVVHQGWRLPDHAWALRRLVCVGVVRNSDEAREVVLAAARGAGVVVGLEAEGGVVESLYQDLRRLGRVELREPASGEGGLELDPEQQRLLELLAEGRSLEQIAADLSYSRRTVSRRLAELRKTLGVASNAEAVAGMARRREGG